MTTIGSLPPATAPAATDLYPTQQADGTTRYATPAQILAAAGGATAAALASETTARAAGDTANASAISAETTRAEAAETAISAVANAALPNTPAALAIAMLTWLDALPVAPNSGGPAIWWNNSGIITYS